MGRFRLESSYFGGKASQPSVQLRNCFQVPASASALQQWQNNAINHRFAAVWEQSYKMLLQLLATRPHDITTALMVKNTLLL